MKKLVKILAVLLPILILATCGGGDSKKLSIPSITNYSISALDGSDYNLGSGSEDLLPATEEEAIEAFFDAFDGLQGIPFLDEIFIDLFAGDDDPELSMYTRAIARAESYKDEVIFEEDGFEEYGVSDLKGKVTYDISGDDTFFNLSLNFVISYDYDSDSDDHSDITPPDFVRGKVRYNGYFKMEGSGETNPTLSMTAGAAFSIALAYRTEEIAGKFIFSIGAAQSVIIDLNSGVASLEEGPLFYGALKVYDDAGTLIHDIKLTEEHLSSLGLDEPPSGSGL